MSNTECNCQPRLKTLTTYALIMLIAIFVASCGGGGSSGGQNSSSSSTTAAGALILQAKVGGVCETYLGGESYSGTLPPLSCNKSTDPYTAHLDGSHSTSASGKPLVYSWSFVSKPAGSTVELTGANTVNPTFVPDKAGSYAVQLVVIDQGVTSQRAVEEVIAIDNATLTQNPSNTPGGKLYKFHGGLSSDCSVCHTPAYTTIQTKPSTHIATSNMCQSCHSPLGFAVASYVDHKEVFGKCSDCHDGVTATGKSAAHIVTTQECSDCHTTESFLTLINGKFNHANTTEPCSACHNGRTAIGTDSDPNPTGHPSISTECNSCHTTDTFKTPFLNHSDSSVVVPGTCGSGGCHDGSSVANGMAITGKNSAPNPHPSTGNITAACDLCHNTTTFNMAKTFDHIVLARHPIACSSCHDGLNAKGKITGHITTSATSDCSNCHNTTTFVGGFVDHATDPSVTGTACTTCHDGTHTHTIINSSGTTITLDIPGKPADVIHANYDPATQSCSDCHTSGGSFSTATVDHSGYGTVAVPNTNIVCTTCHDGVVATGKPLGHLATTQDCGSCHEPQSDSFLGAGYDHSAVSIVGLTATPTCISCHDGSTATGQSLTHVATTGQDCLVCHGTGFSSFALATFDHTAAGISNNCVSCHDGQTHDGVIVITSPKGHIPTTADCSTCHADTTNGPGINGTNTSGFTLADPFVTTVHKAYSTGCRTCHNGPYDNSTYLARKHPTDSVHDTVDANGWDCNACHTTTGNFKELNPVNHQDPAIKAEACVSCHVAGNTVEPIGKSTSHPTTSDTCQDCHQAGGSFTAGFDHTTLDAGGINSGLACSTCHDGLTAIGKPQNHVPTTRDCVTCHAGHPPTASTFIGGTFDHSGPEMTGKQCVDCHDGLIATGKSATHQVTSQDCSACHTTVGTFASNATGFDHTGVVSGCQNSGCHTSGNANVVDVTDDPNTYPHIPILNNGTEVDCYNCHKSPGGTFANASMDHTVVKFEACESCHSGKPTKYDGANTAHIVTLQSSNHIVSKTASKSIGTCATCHTSTSSWSNVKYKHSSSGDYPGDHNTSRVTTCTQCHTDTNPVTYEITTFDNSTYNPTCAVCHLSQFKSGHGGTPSAGKQDCGQCHSVSGSRFNG